jgi:hypothetical protein
MESGVRIAMMIVQRASVLCGCVRSRVHACGEGMQTGVCRRAWGKLISDAQSG